MNHGIDTASNCMKLADDIVKEGYTFVCRYYNVNDPSKNLTREEALRLSEAGIYIVAVWENGYPTKLDYFTGEKGLYDGGKALEIAGKIGQPEGTPIYFAVDYDASEHDVVKGDGKNHDSGIQKYFEGVAQVFGQGHSKYLIGVYGSGLVCELLSQYNPKVQFTWLAQSTGWQGYKDFKSWNIKQEKGMVFHGISVDLDESNGDGGGFKVRKQ